MLTKGPLFEFTLVHEIIVHGLFQTILRGFWLKIVSTIATSLRVVKLGMKLFCTKTKKILDNHANFA